MNTSITHVLLFTGLSALSPSAIGQDHEPMRIDVPHRWTEAKAGPLGGDPGTFDESFESSRADGVWGGITSASHHDADSTASQWSAIGESWIGGYFRADSAAAREPGADASSRLHTFIRIERTALLRARIDLRLEVTGSFSLARGWLTVDQGSGRSMSAHQGTAGVANLEDEFELVIHPGWHSISIGAESPIETFPLGTSTAVAELFAEITTVRLPDCGESDAGPCIEARETPSCSDGRCCDLICHFDPYCCIDQWDEECADRARKSCDSPCEGDLNWDGIVDHLDWSLLAEIAVHGPVPGPTSHDLDGNGVIDMHDLLLIYGLMGKC